MLPPWCFSDFTIIAFSISSIVMLPTGGRASRADSRGSMSATPRSPSASSTSRGADQRGPLDPLPELADVARPGLAPQPGSGGGADARDRRARRCGPASRTNRPASIGMSSGALAQRRHVDGDQVDAVEQVLAELAALDQLGQVAVGGRDDAHVHRAGLARAEHLVGAVLQHAQQLHLRAGVEFADLVEEDRAAVRPSRSGPCDRRARR